MPKILVLFQGSTDTTATLADAVAEGARTIRFSEVEVRCTSQSTGPHRMLEGAGELAAYDAIIVGVPPDGTEMSAQIAVVLDQAGPLGNKVGAAFMPAGSGTDTVLWSIMKAMAAQRMILVPPAGATDPAAATSLGRRVAEVTAWITHARSHHHSH